MAEWRHCVELHQIASEGVSKETFQVVGTGGNEYHVQGRTPEGRDILGLPSDSRSGEPFAVATCIDGSDQWEDFHLEHGWLSMLGAAKLMKELAGVEPCEDQ